jgi:hypothetical protein
MLRRRVRLRVKVPDRDSESQRIDKLGDPEVCQPHLAFVPDHEVGGLDIPVPDPPRVRCTKGLEQFHPDLACQVRP